MEARSGVPEKFVRVFLFFFLLLNRREICCGYGCYYNGGEVFGILNFCFPLKVGINRDRERRGLIFKRKMSRKWVW